MHNPTETARREMAADINDDVPATREAAGREFGKVWTTSEIKNDFEILGFMAPLVIVKRKSDGATGTLLFTHHPRWYFDFKVDS
jgi:hypothetical protein